MRDRDEESRDEETGMRRDEGTGNVRRTVTYSLIPFPNAVPPSHPLQRFRRIHVHQHGIAVDLHFGHHILSAGRSCAGRRCRRERHQSGNNAAASSTGLPRLPPWGHADGAAFRGREGGDQAVDVAGATPGMSPSATMTPSSPPGRAASPAASDAQTLGVMRIVRQRAHPAPSAPPRPPPADDR